MFESSSDDDASSDSSYQLDSEDYSETSDSESEDTLQEVQQSGISDDDAAEAQSSTSRDLPQNDPQSNAARNSFIWHQLTASFTPKFPTHGYILSKPTLAMPSTLKEIDSFKAFFPKSLCIFIAQCTNGRVDLDNIQKNATIFHTDEGEVMVLLGVVFVRSYNRLPNLSNYWSSNSSMGNQFIKNVISRNRFQFLMSKLYYVEELVNFIKQTFSNAMSESSDLSIDKSMVKFKGHPVLKQYLPLKPTKKGVKVWQRCDAQTG